MKKKKSDIRVRLEDYSSSQKYVKTQTEGHSVAFRVKSPSTSSSLSPHPTLKIEEAKMFFCFPIPWMKEKSERLEMRIFSDKTF